MRVSFRVFGEVQGIGYRRFTAREAQMLDLAGWVRNGPDGSVCGEVDGPETALAAFRARLAHGHTFASVERLDWAPLDVGTSSPFPFEIRR
jgi:acylphosphatase